MLNFRCYLIICLNWWKLSILLKDISLILRFGNVDFNILVLLEIMTLVRLRLMVNYNCVLSRLWKIYDNHIYWKKIVLFGKIKGNWIWWLINEEREKELIGIGSEKKKRENCILRWIIHLKRESFYWEGKKRRKRNINNIIIIILRSLFNFVHHLLPHLLPSTLVAPKISTIPIFVNLASSTTTHHHSGTDEAIDHLTPSQNVRGAST